MQYKPKTRRLQNWSVYLKKLGSVTLFIAYVSNLLGRDLYFICTEKVECYKSFDMILNKRREKNMPK